MPLKTIVGLCQKIGQRDFGSLGATCHVKFTLDQTHLQDDLEAFQQQVRAAFAACRQAVQDELTRQREPLAATKPVSAKPASNGNGQPHTNGSNGTSTQSTNASDKQMAYVRRLVSQIPDVGVRRLDEIAQHLCGVPIAGLNRRSEPPDRYAQGPQGPRDHTRQPLIRNPRMIVTTPVLETLPQRRSGVWDDISPSRLNLWLKCPLAFKARYIDGIPSPTTPSLFVAKRTHQALEDWYPPRQERHFTRLFAVIREYLDALDRGQFNFRPGWTCGSCDYRETFCAAWGG